MKPKTAILIASALLLLAVASVYVALCRYQPPLPERWQQIHRGQLRREVLAHLPELGTENYEMKRCDQTQHFSQSPLFGRVSQYLIVVYGPDDRVTDIQVRTLTARFRLLRNKTSAHLP